MPASAGLGNQWKESNGKNSSPTQGQESKAISPAVTAYAERLKSLSNCEIWTQVEAAIQTLNPAAEAEVEDWGQFRALLDELRWRLSGLEGVRSTSEQVLILEEHNKLH